MMTPILNEIGTVFIPVQNIHESKAWYCDLLGVPSSGEVIDGHLYVLPMNGTGIVLDSKIYSEKNIYSSPAFHLNTKDINLAYSFMKEKGIEVTTEIENGHWFTFKDPDGNLLMVCQ